MQRKTREDYRVNNFGQQPQIAILIDGREYTREEIRQWELHRLDKVIGILRSRLGSKEYEAVLEAANTSTEPKEVSEKRKALMVLKTHIGDDGMRKMMATRTRLSGFVARAAKILSRGQKVVCSIEMYVSEGTAEEFLNWFLAHSEADDEAEMLAACPDHYLIRSHEKGHQEVIETTGGSPLPSRFFVDFTSFEGIIVPRDDSYPLYFGGRCFLEDGFEIGGALHQLRNEENGFKLLLGIEFPRALPKRFIYGHYWHLACEFSNWIEAALQERNLK